jgi:hypothetical protein
MSRVVASSASSGQGRTPGWLNPRVIAGIVLVLAATVLGAVVVGRAQHSTRVWATTRALAPGIVLRADDLQAVKVRVPGNGSTYVKVGDRKKLIGLTVNRPLSAHGLLPGSALSSTAPGTMISVPLPSGDAPPMARGERVRLWVSTKSCQARVVLTDVAVQDVASTGGGTFGTGTGQTLALRVSPGDAQRVVQALSLDSAVVRAAVLTGPPDPAAQGGLSGCTATS